MGTCAVCGAASPVEARYCSHCGSALGFPCERCGAELPPAARFCPACGAPVVDHAHPGEERKLVTVLFADVVGSTALGERLDPEHLKDVMGSYFHTMRREIEAEGGTVEKFIGDAVVAVFGAPVAHEDDPTRALRAAIRMARALDRLNRNLAETHGVTLAMRMGVNTGEVMVVATPAAAEGMVTGDAVNVAARLEQSAGTGQILVAQRTAHAARGIMLREVGPLSLKGKGESILTFELIDPETGGAAVPPPGDIERRPHLAPIVGREQELAVLRTLFQRVGTDQRPHLVTIYGDPGVGKSRLVEEFETWAAALPQAPRVVRGRCLPYGEGVAYWPLGEILKAHAGVLDTDPPEVALSGIRETVGRLLSESSELSVEAERTAAVLAFTVGLEDKEAPIGAAEPRQVRMLTHDAWQTYFSALSLGGPVVVQIEDIHWADRPLLDLLEELAERAVGPLLFLCPARPELTARRPGWGGGTWNFSALLLEPLPTAEAERLLDALPGGRDIPDGLRARILDRAGGNPFFLEEIVRHVLEERPAEESRNGEGWDVEVPDTVQGVLAARMDLLAPPEKRVLQSAAAVGRVFWTSPVARLVGKEHAPEEIDDVLTRLEARGLVMARLSSTVGGEREYAFRHVLTRDVAYESLPRRERSAAHAQTAAWIEERAGERQREFAELLAYHYAEAYRGLGEHRHVDPSRLEEVRAHAFHYALLAAEDERSKLVLDAAKLHAEAALSLAEGPLERSRALEALGQAHFHGSEGDEAWRSLKEAADLRIEAEEAGPGTADGITVARLCTSALEVATRYRGAMRSRLSQAEAAPYLDIALSHVGGEDSEELTRLLIVRAGWPYAFRDVDPSEAERLEARRAGEDATAMALRLGRPDLASAALDGVGDYYFREGLYGPMGPLMEQRLELTVALTDPYEIGDIHATAAWQALHVGRYGRAMALADEGFRRSLPGSLVAALYCLDLRALARCRLGEWEAFMADVALAGELLADRRDHPPGFAAQHVAAAAFVHEVRGDQGAADRFLRILDWLEREEERPSPAWGAWRALILARRGAFDDARAVIDRYDIPILRYGRDQVLEARTDLTAEARDWHQAPGVVEEVRRHARRAELEALPLFASRLEGRAAFAAGDDERATRLLEAASRGFDELGAAWEAAVTRLDLARAHARWGDGELARKLLSAAIPVLDRLRTVRELVDAGELLDNLR